jgi:8-oxo-dGTP pyrophosphatase MutT (NUDIX family)
MIAQGIIRRYNSFLMVHQVKHGRQFWNFPGGHIEEGEAPDQTCIREILEETGLTATITDFIGMAGPKYIYTVDIISGEIVLEPGMLDYAWVTEEDADKWDNKTLEILALYKQHFAKPSLSKGHL